MSTKEHAGVVHRFLEDLWNQGKLDLEEEILSPDYVRHDPADTDVHGPAEHGKLVAMYRAAFPDIRFTVEEQIIEGDTVVVRWTVAATHQGELKGIPATGKAVECKGISIYHVTSGKISGEFTNWDTLGLLRQLDVIPAMEG